MKRTKGALMSNTKEIADTYLAKTYAHFPLEIVSGKGSLVYDEQGKEYIDLGSGIAVNAFGVADDAWIEAVTAQLGKVQHTSNLYYSEPCALLAKQLCERTGMKRVFFGNSGAEANECGIKVARKYAQDKYGQERNIIVTLENSFHGRTLTTLAATGQEHYHELFTPLTPGFVSVPANNLDAMRALVEQEDGKVAGIMMECVQGEGGVVALTEEFMQGVAALCAEKDIILVIDEVQTGNGRSGHLYAYEHFGIKPDVVTTAKGLGGGLPLGACIIGEKAANVLGAGDHGSTFGGNPVCCAGALSVLGRIDDALLEEVKAKSTYVFETLQGAQGVENVSGLGLMIGIKPTKPAGEVVAACMEAGVLCLTAKDRVRLLPALNIPMDLLKQSVEVIKNCCA
jgi:acetylornithine/N-succinyldiaminopimelate aminotransferase